MNGGEQEQDRNKVRDSKPQGTSREESARRTVTAQAMEMARAVRALRQGAALSRGRDEQEAALSPKLTPPAQPSLQIRRVDEPDRTTLYLSGVLDLGSLLRLRDEAFTAIGSRPQALCLDLHLISRVEFAGINTLVTIGRVARLTRVPFTLCASATLTDLILQTGLFNILTLENAEVAPA